MRMTDMSTLVISSSGPGRGRQPYKRPGFNVIGADMVVRGFKRAGPLDSQNIRADSLDFYSHFFKKPAESLDVRLGRGVLDLRCAPRSRRGDECVFRSGNRSLVKINSRPCKPPFRFKIKRCLKAIGFGGGPV